MRCGLLWQLHSTELSGVRMSKITSLLYLILQQGWEMAIVCWVSLLSWGIVLGSFTVPLPPDSIGIGIMTFYPQILLSRHVSLQSCPTLCEPIDGSPPGSPVPGILQARTLEWVAISFSNAWKGKVKVKSLSHVRLLVTPWTAAHQAPPSMGVSRQEYWSGCH